MIGVFSVVTLQTSVDCVMCFPQVKDYVRWVPNLKTRNTVFSEIEAHAEIEAHPPGVVDRGTVPLFPKIWYTGDRKIMSDIFLENHSQNVKSCCFLRFLGGF